MYVFETTTANRLVIVEIMQLIPFVVADTIVVVAVAVFPRNIMKIGFACHRLCGNAQYKIEWNSIKLNYIYAYVEMHYKSSEILARGKFSKNYQTRFLI